MVVFFNFARHFCLTFTRYFIKHGCCQLKPLLRKIYLSTLRLRNGAWFESVRGKFQQNFCVFTWATQRWKSVAERAVSSFNCHCLYIVFFGTCITLLKDSNGNVPYWNLRNAAVINLRYDSSPVFCYIKLYPWVLRLTYPWRWGHYVASNRRIRPPVDAASYPRRAECSATQLVNLKTGI